MWADAEWQVQYVGHGVQASQPYKHSVQTRDLLPGCAACGPCISTAHATRWNSCVLQQELPSSPITDGRSGKPKAQPFFLCVWAEGQPSGNDKNALRYQCWKSDEAWSILTTNTLYLVGQRHPTTRQPNPHDMQLSQVMPMQMPVLPFVPIRQLRKLRQMGSTNLESLEQKAIRLVATPADGTSSRICATHVISEFPSKGWKLSNFHSCLSLSWSNIYLKNHSKLTVRRVMARFRALRQWLHCHCLEHCVV